MLFVTNMQSCSVSSFYHAGFWSINDYSSRKFTEGSNEMNIEMVNAPQIGERCMDAYMRVKFGASDDGVFSNDVDNDEAISVLTLSCMQRNFYFTSK